MRTGLLVSLILAISVAPVASLGATEGKDFVLIVHPELEPDSITSAELSKIFLKRLRTWSSGEIAAPVDRQPESPLRRDFSEQVHGRSVINVEVYWKRMIFSGRSVPPPELETDAEVVDFVGSTPGAVGYVSRAASLRGVKELRLRE